MMMMGNSIRQIWVKIVKHSICTYILLAVKNNFDLKPSNLVILLLLQNLSFYYGSLKDRSFNFNCLFKYVHVQSIFKYK